MGKEGRSIQVNISWETKTEESQSFLKWLENLERGISIRSGAVAVLRVNIGSDHIVCLQRQLLLTYSFKQDVSCRVLLKG